MVYNIRNDLEVNRNSLISWEVMPEIGITPNIWAISRTKIGYYFCCHKTKGLKMVVPGPSADCK